MGISVKHASLAKLASAASYWSVRTYLIFLVLACLLPGFIGASFFFAYEYKKGQTQLSKDTLQTARALVQAVDTKLLMAQAIGQSLSTSDSLENHDLAKFYLHAQKTVALSGTGTNIVLRDKAGRQLINTAVEYGKPSTQLTFPEQVREVFETGKPSYSNLFFGPILKRLLVSVDVPVFIKEEVAYALGVGILPEDLNALLINQNLPEDWVVVILDKSNTIVARSHLAEQFIGKKTAPKLAQVLQNSREGSVELTTVEGIPVVSVYSRSLFTNWTVAIGIPREALEKSMISSLEKLAAGIVILFSVGMVLAWIIGGTIARAVKALIDPAAALADNIALPVIKTHVHEADEVAKAIKLAAELLKERAAKLQLKESEVVEAHRLAKFGNWYWNLQTNAVDVSDSIAEIYGRAVPSFDEQRGTLLPIESWEKVNAAVQEVLRTGEGFDLELQVNHADGHIIWINSKCKAIYDAQGDVVALHGAIQDISERKEAEQRVRSAALHDVLTGLPNRAFIFEYGTRLIAAARRGHGSGALLFIDLDRFKPINDLYGHEVGDSVLQQVSKRISSCTRQEDLVGRLGGDEFVVILPYIKSDTHRAVIVAQNIIDSLSQPYRITSYELSLSASIGISYFPTNATDISILIHTADLAMYQAKQNGRANYQNYTPELDQRANQALAIELKLKSLLKKDGLTLHYQPVIDLQSGKLVGAEALARLIDNDGEISPSTFIPIAESTGLIIMLGDWVAREACRQQVEWCNKGLNIRIAINVSPVQFRQQNFVDKLHAVIKETGINPTFLEIEVTESTLMENVDDAIEILNRIKSLGIYIALDDFGTGYSSLSSLTRLPLNKLKVDQSFVRRVEHDAASRAVTETVIALGRSLNLDVHGEGIETESALDYLRQHGCNQAQGFLFSKALPAAEFLLWSQGR